MKPAVLMLGLANAVVGTAIYFVSGLLDAIARDLQVSVSAAGQLVSVFALTYALAAPLLVAVTTRVDRRRLLTGALCVFALANLAAASAPGLGALLGARLLAALTAALVTPVAVATGAALVAPDRRGAAIAVVMGGITLAFAFGVPLGTLAGELLGWRAVFAGLAGCALLAAAAVRRLLPAMPGERAKGIDAFGVLRDPEVSRTLMLTVLVFVTAFTVFAYIGPLLATVAGLSGRQVSGMLLVFGIAALAGTFLGGKLADRIDARAVIRWCLAALVLATGAFSLLAWLPAGPWKGFAAALVMAANGAAVFAFISLQQYRLVRLAGERANMVIALNASAIFLGQGLGSGVGGVVAASGGLALNGLVGAAIGLLAVALILRRAGTPAASGA